MHNANSYERVTSRGRHITSATLLDLRQKRHKPVSLPSTIKIEVSVETSSARMPRGDNSKHDSVKAAGISLEFMLNSF